MLSAQCLLLGFVSCVLVSQLVDFDYKAQQSCDMGAFMWNVVTTLFREYMGAGLIMIFYLVSLIYLWMREKRKFVRILFVYVPVVLLLLFFNPLFAKILYGLLGDEIYYRMLWLLPVTVTVAYTAASIYGSLSDRNRATFALAAAAGIAVSGSFIYNNQYFQKAENIYHVPDSVVHICDAIAVPGREIQAAFPLEMVQFVRQYDPTICMPYGREVTVDRWNKWSELPDEMEKETIDLSRLAPLAKEEGCHFVIIPEDKMIVGNPAEYHWEVFGRMDGYVIFRDTDYSLLL